MKTLYSEYYGGTITLQMCETLNDIPQSARYKYDDWEDGITDKFYAIPS